jgi:hypothetical protein
VANDALFVLVNVACSVPIDWCGTPNKDFFDSKDLKKKSRTIFTYRNVCCRGHLIQVPSGMMF